LLLSSLDDSDLRQEVIVVTLQYLMFARGILVVESDLLSVVIYSDMLFLHLHFYVGEHLKSMTFE